MRDKTLAGALRAAYLDFLPPDRHAVVALFVECEPSEVDVNVHPAKAEVRFRDSGLVRGLIVGAIKQRFERSAAPRREHRRDGDDSRHARAAGVPARAVPAALGLARLARGAARFAEPAQARLRRARRLRADAGRACE